MAAVVMGSALIAEVIEAMMARMEGKEDACYLAAINGDPALMKFYYQHGCPLDERVFAAVAGLGNLQVLKWLKKLGCPWDKEACAQAAMNGYMEVLKWLREPPNPCPWDPTKMCQYAAESGQLQVLRWLVKHGCLLDKETFLSACFGCHVHGNLDVIRWLTRKGIQFPYSEYSTKAIFGDGHHDDKDFRNHKHISMLEYSDDE